MLSKIYLAVIGFLYLALAIWCTVDPVTTSRKVGFNLDGDSGRSEFITVYGGLEFGLALILLLPFVNSEMTRFSLMSCVIIHAALVVFRSGSLLLHRDVAGFTQRLALYEWVIFLIGAAVWWVSSRAKTGGS